VTISICVRGRHTAQHPFEDGPRAMIHLDTSLLIDALCGTRRSALALRAAITQGDRIALSSIVLFEWLRGPRIAAELTAQEGLFPRHGAIAFGLQETTVAAALHRRLKSARGRDIDLAIAATAIVHGAQLWTLDTRDFVDIPGLRLYQTRG